MSKHLAHHRVEATLDYLKAGGRSIGDVFKDYVGEHKIDLLVMGGYGHSRTREFILGGATRSILTQPPTWVLMSHCGARPDNEAVNSPGRCRLPMQGNDG